MTDDNNKPNTLRKKILSWLPYIAIPLIVYFGNVEVQSYLGRKALSETGLTMHSLEEAKALASSSNKLVLMDVSAIWCPSCRRLDSEVLANEKVKDAIDRSYVFSRVEYESEEAEAILEKYQVHGFPTLLVLDAQGNKIRKLPLTFSPEEFISHINQG